MLKNYIRIAIRSLSHNKSTSAINLLGLTIGLVCCLIIFVYVRHELSYDRFHKASDELYRIITIDKALGVSSNHVAITLPPLAEAMKQSIPEVVDAVRISGYPNQVSHGDQRFNLDDVRMTEPGFFRLFDFGLIEGNPGSALSEPNTAVLTETTAKRIFGRTNVIGELLEINNRSVKLTGVMPDWPSNTHLDFDMLVSMLPTEADSNRTAMLQSWQQISMISYVQLTDASQQAAVEQKMESLIRDNDVGENFSVILQPLHEVHLKSEGIIFDGYNTNKSSSVYVYTLLVVAIFILLIAAFNYMNLSTARSTKRAKEVGLRKVVGAERSQLIFQFIIESTILCLAALFVALAMAGLVGQWMDLGLPTNPVKLLAKDTPLMIMLVIGTVILGIASGSYPAFMLSSFQPVKVLKGSFIRSGSGLWMRRALVVLQFTASTAMIIGTMVVYQQLKLMQEMDKGFDPEQIITFNLNHPSLQENFEQLENELRKIPTVKAIATTSSMPGQGFGRNGIQPEGYTEEEIWIVSVMAMDENYLSLMDMDVSYGRNFSDEMATDSTISVLINETLAKKLNWEGESAIGKTVSGGPQRLIVAGVVKDFHFNLLQHEIEPLMMYYQSNPYGTVCVKVDSKDMANSLSAIESSWSQINPGFPFEATFFDESYAQQFESEQNFASLVVIFTWLAIFIACLGLLGLSAFAAEQRTKEIGIRKVLGASVPNLVQLLSRELAILVSISVVIAGPIAWWIMEDWLSAYAYRIDMPWWVFGLAAVLALGIAILTNMYHAVRTATQNPVRALRYE